jgi:hypothetical protein
VTAAAGRRLAVRLGHLLVVLVGLALLAYPFTLGASTALTCRGEPMRPGSVCLKADGSAGQTYEQRLATRRSARPVLVGVGLLVTGFGAALLVGDLRRREPDALRSPVEDAG